MYFQNRFSVVWLVEIEPAQGMGVLSSTAISTTSQATRLD